MLDIASNSVLKPALLSPVPQCSGGHKEMVKGTLKIVFSLDLKHAKKDSNMYPNSSHRGGGGRGQDGKCSHFPPF